MVIFDLVASQVPHEKISVHYPDRNHNQHKNERGPVLFMPGVRQQNGEYCGCHQIGGQPLSENTLISGTNSLVQ